MTEEEKALEIERSHLRNKKLKFQGKTESDIAEILMHRTQKLIKELLAEGFNPEQICFICLEINNTFKIVLERVNESKS